MNRGRDVYVVDHDYTQFVDSFEATIGGHQVIGADLQGRGEYHGVDGEHSNQPVRTMSECSTTAVMSSGRNSPGQPRTPA